MSESNLSPTKLLPANENIEKLLWLFGFRIDPGTEEPNLYTLIAYGERELPLVVGGQLVFFTRPELAINALQLCGIDVSELGTPPSEIDAICDVAETLYLLDAEDVDESDTILDCLNALFDLVKATSIPMPTEYKRVLYAFADYLNFEQEFAGFFAEEDIQRSEIVNAILWCVGAISAKSKLLT
ncbi:MAG: hypothetical protein HC849_15615 [Oscillatoriales cyanobacterium RU_3_3]|nr:hypothetical protein [Microcoleus sp. SU_5_6]NJM61302.1 hypothetical protein [Oscillatoriales cyanobacterium RU_3_3]NJR25085.1 hypothetical protein [Richelia sp. CSU_2_1]